MPNAAPKPCTQCGVLVRDGTARCEQHKVQPGRFGDRSRGTRQERGYGATWDRLRLQVLARDCGICQPCLREGRVHEATEVDHVVSKAQYRRLHGTLAGVDHEGNLQAINHDCHLAKTQRDRQQARGRSKTF
jgi:5-methylcytosine-specific restriction protein A